jgi:chaperonin GroEL
VSKLFSCDEDLTARIATGINKLADNVASTLGPRGRNVILQKKGGNPIVTKDGVTVAEFVELEDPFENVGAQVIKQASRMTNAEAGDGTTTATVLARAIYANARQLIASGHAPIQVKRKIDQTVEEIVKRLGELSKPISSIEDVRHIAMISANNDEEIGELIARAVESVGKDGSITVEEARSLKTSLDLVEGFRMNSGYASSSFITDERRGAVVYEDAFILVADAKIDKVDDILPVLEVVAREGRPLVIVSSEVEGQALAALIMNTMRGTMKVAAVKAPQYGEERRNILRDLCLSTGASYVTRSAGLKLKEVTLEHLGRAKKIDITKAVTTIVGGKGSHEEVEKKIEALKIEASQTDSMREAERIQERITRLASGIAVIRVGAATEVEMVEKRHRIEDALEAVKAAREEGIVPGGGVALVRTIPKIRTPRSIRSGVKDIVYDAICEPIRQMAKNAGTSPDVVLEKVKKAKGNTGWDFAQNKTVDMFEHGVIDPAKVTRCALQNAASAVGALITSGYAIVEV